MNYTEGHNTNNLLVISSNPTSLQQLCRTAHAAGYRSISAADSETAIAAIRRSNFDLVVLETNGAPDPWYDFLEFVFSRRQHVPLILISANQYIPALTERYENPILYLLTAPVEPIALEKSISEAFSQRRLNVEYSALQNHVQQSEKLHQFLLNNSPDIIYILNEHGEVSYINDRVESLLNVRKDNIVGKHFSLLMSDDEYRKHPFVFNERRSIKRHEQRSELHLRKHLCLNTDGSSTAISVPFEVSAMGIYEHQRPSGKTVFKGTYGIARDITDRRQAESLMRFQAYHDMLTGLPNRSLFRDRLSLAISHSKRNGSLVAVMFVDLDRFKLINDSLGHTIGDQVIQAVARRISSSLREGDTLSRFGGDEFTLLLPNIHSQDDAVIIAKKILQELKEPFFIEQHELFVAGSIGIALYPEHGKHIDQLIQNADIAMYHIKANGKNGYQFFNEKMNQAYADRLHTEQDLRQCVNNNQLFLEYQPIFNVETSEVYALEAYVRWDHPARGVLLPQEFLQVAEETGIIVDLGAWVINRVCADLQEWANPVLKIAVNFSPRQVEHLDFENMLMSAVMAHNVSPNQIELEITEDLLVGDLAQITSRLRRLSRLGFSISIDDFGTGYSSLSSLHQLPINTIKLHESFLNQIDNQYQSGDACIVNAIAAMANGLNLNLVAEGVENQQQKDYLVNLGCHTMQGKLFHGPVPSEQARGILITPVPLE